MVILKNAIFDPLKGQKWTNDLDFQDHQISSEQWTIQALFMVSSEIISLYVFPVEAFKVESSHPDRRTDGRMPEATTITALAGGQGAKNGRNSLSFLFACFFVLFFFFVCFFFWYYALKKKNFSETNKGKNIACGSVGLLE